MVADNEQALGINRHSRLGGVACKQLNRLEFVFRKPVLVSENGNHLFTQPRGRPRHSLFILDLGFLVLEFAEHLQGTRVLGQEITRRGFFPLDSVAVSNLVAFLLDNVQRNTSL